MFLVWQYATYVSLMSFADIWNLMQSSSGSTTDIGARSSNVKYGSNVHSSRVYYLHILNILVDELYINILHISSFSKSTW